MNLKRLLFSAVLLAATTSGLRATNYYVDTDAQFNAGVDKNGNNFTTLYAGDRVYLKGSTNWGGIVQTLTGSMTDAAAQTNPAIVYACDSNYNPTPGGVIVNGVSRIQLEGAGIVFSGVTFSSKSGMYPMGVSTDIDDVNEEAYMIATMGESRYMTISHVKFDYCGKDCTSTNDHYGPWVMLWGYGNTLQYCDIQGHDFNPNDSYVTNNPVPYNGYNRTSIRDTRVLVLMHNSDTVRWGHHIIRHNYFGPRAVPRGTDVIQTAALQNTNTTANLANSWDTIRLGVSTQATNTFACVVEHNTFYHTMWDPAGNPSNTDLTEPEMIAVKSRGNIIRNNTVLNTTGEISLRQNAYTTVVGNWILAGCTYATNGTITNSETVPPLMGGVRSFGFGNIIANNYFYNISGTESLASGALLLGEGNSPTTDTNGNYVVGVDDGTLTGAFYPTAVYNWVVGNTFYNCNTISIDWKKSTNPVYGTRFINNLIYYSTNVSAAGVTGQNKVAITTYGGVAFGNWVYTPSAYSSQLGSAVTMLGSASNVITTNAASNPLVTAAFDAVFVPTTNSPVGTRGLDLPAVNDNSSNAANYTLSADVTTYAKGLDGRGLARPASNPTIGNYEIPAKGNGSRPLHRTEVGIVTNTYYPMVFGTNASVTLSGSGMPYDGTALVVSATTKPELIPVVFTYNGSSNAPTGQGTYTVVGAVYDTFYTGSSTTTLLITASVAPIISTNNLNIVAVTTNALSYQVPLDSGTATGYSASGLPTGLSIDASTGLISGTATQTGTFTVTLSAWNGVATNTATLTLTVASSLSGLTNSFTTSGSTNWICPANVSALQIECWGGGGSGGSASRASGGSGGHQGGGGAGGAYAKLNSFTVTPGTTYTVNVGAGGSSNTSTTNGTTIAGGDSWFNSTNNILAKGGAGGASSIGGGAGAGGTGTTNGSIGDVLYAGGSGMTTTTANYGGPGGGSGGTGGAGNAPASSTNGVGATAVTGGGNGGNANAVSGSSGPGQAPTTPPGGGGGGARSSSSSLQNGGAGATGKVLLTVATISSGPTAATITLSNTNQTYDGTAKSVTATPSPSAAGASLTYSNSTYGSSSNAPTNAGSYTVTANVTNASYTGSTTGTLTIAKATPAFTVVAGSLSQTYTGSGLSVTLTNNTNAGGTIPTSTTYNGVTNLPVGAGTYTVIASASDTNNYNTYSVTNSLVIAKASGTVSFSGTNTTYDGTAKSVSASTVPTNLTVTLTYNGSSSAPTNAGTYTVAGTISDANYTGSNTGTLTIAKATSPAFTFTTGSLSQTYSGSGLSATLSNAGSTPTTVTYNGSTSAPVGAGTYTVIASVSDTNNYNTYSVTNSLVIAKAAGTVSFTNTNATYDGTAKSVTASTVPTNLAVTLTYDGAAAAPTNAGSYAVVGSISDANYTGSNTGTLTIAKAAATITFSGTNATYDGTAKAATASPSPSAAGASLTYSNATYGVSSNAPTNAGSYTLNSSVTNANYTGSNTGTLTIAKATSPAFTFTTGSLSQTYSGSGLSATLSNAGSTPTTVTYNGSTSAPVGAGTYTVIASVSDTNNYNTYSVTNSLVIAKASGTVSFTNTNATYDGTAKSVTAGTVPVGLTVDLTYDGAAAAPTNAGSYAVVGSISDANYTGSNTGTLTIAKAAATITFSGTNATYDGTAKAATASPSPSAAGASLTYSNATYGVSSNAPTNAGSYTLNSSVTNANYTGSNTGTLTIAKGAALITFSGTNQPYNGFARSVTASTVPTNLTIGTLTYNGSATAPSAVGSYPLLASVTDSNYAGTNTGTLVIYDAVALWRSNTFGTTNNSGNAADSADPNGNGLSNLQEYALGTDPNLPSTNGLMNIAISNNTFTLSFTARQAGTNAGYSGLTRFYSLQGTTNLNDSNSWVAIPGYSNITATNQTVTFSTNNSATTKWFYRLRAWLQ